MKLQLLALALLTTLAINAKQYQATMGLLGNPSDWAAKGNYTPALTVAYPTPQMGMYDRDTNTLQFTDPVTKQITKYDAMVIGWSNDKSMVDGKYVAMPGVPIGYEGAFFDTTETFAADQPPREVRVWIAMKKSEAAAPTTPAKGKI